MDYDFTYLDVIYNVADRHGYALFCRMLDEIEGKIEEDAAMFLLRRYDFTTEDEYFFERLVRNMALSEELIWEFRLEMDWYYVCRSQRLSESLLEKVIDEGLVKNFDWKAISEYQRLSEAFIRWHCDKLNWYLISFYQSISKEFACEFYGRINIRNLSENPHVSEHLREMMRTLLEKPDIGRDLSTILVADEQFL